MKIRQWRFTVQGSGQFPADMLRYDACWPHSQEDVVKTKLNAPPHAALYERKVNLVSAVKAPTAERWISFGWTVLSVEEIR